MVSSINLEQNIIKLFDESGFNIKLPGEHGMGKVTEPYIVCRITELESQRITGSKMSVRSLIDVILTSPLDELGNHNLFEKMVKEFLTTITNNEQVDIIGKAYRFYYQGNSPKIVVDDNESYTSSLQFVAADLVDFNNK